MARETLPLTPALGGYIRDVSLREPDLLRRLRHETAAHPLAQMQVAPEQGQLLGLLVRLMGARQTLEIGVFTGYSALSVALALPPDGRLVACDVSEAFTDVARRYWHEAGVTAMIDLRIAPARDTLDALIRDGRTSSFDFAFIDADKTGYVDYYERALQLVRPGGLIAADNVLRGGRVVDPSVTEADTAAIRAFNRHVHHDNRVHISLISVGDGMTLALKK